MPTDLILQYSAYQIITLPNKIAEKLKENKDTEWGKPWSWYVRFTVLFYYDGNGVKHEVDSEDCDTDYKEAEDYTWLDAKDNDTDDSDDSESEEELPVASGDEDPKDN
jgi:hypothetical protein